MQVFFGRNMDGLGWTVKLDRSHSAFSVGGEKPQAVLLSWECTLVRKFLDKNWDGCSRIANCLDLVKGLDDKLKKESRVLEYQIWRSSKV